MQKEITITYSNGETATFVANPPDFVRWELATKKSIGQFSGMYDLLFVAHSAMKRESVGKQIKPLDIWMESIIDIEVGDDNPKVIAEEVSADS
jgi:hypothetical protein